MQQAGSQVKPILPQAPNTSSSDVNVIVDPSGLYVGRAATWAQFCGRDPSACSSVIIPPKGFWPCLQTSAKTTPPVIRVRSTSRRPLGAGIENTSETISDGYTVCTHSRVHTAARTATTPDKGVQKNLNTHR